MRRNSMACSTKSFLICFATVLAILLVTAVAASIYTDANHLGSFRIALGPMLLVDSVSTPTRSAMTLGPGLAFAAFAFALLNQVAAVAVCRRSTSPRAERT